MNLGTLLFVPMFKTGKMMYTTQDCIVIKYVNIGKNLQQNEENMVENELMWLY